jgi:hypothetical protein
MIRSATASHSVPASAARHPALGRVIPRLVWTAAVLTTMAGAVTGVGVTLATNGPPQEAAAMALAYAVVVAPYVFVARSLNQLMK